MRYLILILLVFLPLHRASAGDRLHASTKPAPSPMPSERPTPTKSAANARPAKAPTRSRSAPTSHWKANCRASSPKSPLTAPAYTINGDEQFRIFYVDSGALTLQNIHLTAGLAHNEVSFTFVDGVTGRSKSGGAIIANRGSRLELINSRFHQQCGGSLWRRAG